MDHPFQMIDVFNDQAFSGNPLAVVLNADGLTTEQMQNITRWFNLSETTFLLTPTTPGADYRVRIFTLDREMPFAGHPTLGSCHAWLATQGKGIQKDEIIQECNVGLVPLRRIDGNLAFAAPPLKRSGPVDEAKTLELAEFLNVDRSDIVHAEWVDNGPGWVGVLMKSAEAVLAVEPRKQVPSHTEVGLVGMYPANHPLAYEVRGIFSDQFNNVIEDPVTGSLNASLAQWLLASRRVTSPYVASQGTRLGRTGRIYINQDAAGAVWVGGKTQTIVSGVCSM